MNPFFDDEVKTGLDFILSHFSFSAFAFPRIISTKTTQDKQITVNNKAEALARFKQANYLDCKINAYSKHDIKGDPNFIFIDIDNPSKKFIDDILEERLGPKGAHPTVLFTGSGYHIYQPLDTKSIRIDELDIFQDLSYIYVDPSNQFLRFAERYLSENKSDPNHNPSVKSCMVRIPGTVNSKNNCQVKILQEWDGKRLDIRYLLGSFYAHIRTVQTEQEKCAAAYSNYKNSNPNANGKRKWIEENLLLTALKDCRKTIVNLVLAPYLINIRRLSFEQASGIIGPWLKLCSTERELDFNPRNLTQAALIQAKKSGYKPMSLNTLKQKNCTLYQILTSHDLGVH